MGATGYTTGLAPSMSLGLRRLRRQHHLRQHHAPPPHQREAPGLRAAPRGAERPAAGLGGRWRRSSSESSGRGPRRPRRRAHAGGPAPAPPPPALRGPRFRRRRRRPAGPPGGPHAPRQPRRRSSPPPPATSPQGTRASWSSSDLDLAPSASGLRIRQCFQLRMSGPGCATIRPSFIRRSAVAEDARRCCIAIGKGPSWVVVVGPAGSLRLRPRRRSPPQDRRPAPAVEDPIPASSPPPTPTSPPASRRAGRPPEPRPRRVRPGRSTSTSALRAAPCRAAAGRGLPAHAGVDPAPRVRGPGRRRRLHGDACPSRPPSTRSADLPCRSAPASEETARGRPRRRCGARPTT